MSTPRVLVLGLDGWDQAYAESLLTAGELPAFAALGAQSARFLLDPEGRQLDGLDWEHFVSGFGPEVTQRTSALNFDPDTYEAWQEGARFPPFFDRLQKQSVVFDVPYCDFADTVRVRGIEGWAASDAGVMGPISKPESLLGELTDRFGPYPSHDCLDGISWPTIAQTQAMATGLVEGLVARRNGACWLFGEAIPDWDLAVVVATETHSAAEAFWHGVDSRNALFSHPTACHAAKAMQDVYRETDRLLAELLEKLQPDRILVFALNGMANNRMDVPSMCLLPELLYRESFHKRHLDVSRFEAELSGDFSALLGDKQSWDAASASWFSVPEDRGGVEAVLRQLRRKGSRLGLRRPDPRSKGRSGSGETESIEWHPAMRYRESWHRMSAFALPSYSVGRIRINLKGRERDGIVDPADYDRVCSEVVALLDSCRDARTGELVAKKITCAPYPDLLTSDTTREDITVIWRDDVCSFDHPVHGRMGPLPLRRLADHCGEYGFVFAAGAGIEPGNRGVRSELDVPATIVELLDAPPLPGLSGRSLLSDAN